jgi:hypothetical protein
MAFLRTAESFTGTAVELVPRLVEMDGELREKLTAKRLGKRLAALWPHLEKAINATREIDRRSVTHFSFKPRL